MNRTEKILTVLGSILLPFFLLLLSYYAHLQATSLSVEQEQVFQFLREEMDTLGDKYTAAEVSHLQDVQLVMQAANIFFYSVLLLIFLMAGVAYYYQLNWRQMLWYISWSSPVVIGFITIFTLLAFNLSFTAFHLLLFPQGNWQFPADSFLVQNFPATFFQLLGIKIVITALVLGLGSIFIIRYFVKPK